MEAEMSSEMLLNIYQDTWLHLPEDSNLPAHSGENLRSHTTMERFAV
jgi:hypothetical protein